MEADGRVNLYILSEAGWSEDYPIESIVYSLNFAEKPIAGMLIAITLKGN